MKTLEAFALAIICNFAFFASAQRPVAGNYNGIFAEPSGIAHESAGFIKVTVRSLGTFSGYLLLDGDRMSFSGKNFPTNVVISSRTNKFGKEPLTLSLTAKLPLETEQIIGTITSSSWTAEVSADRAVWSFTNPTTNFFVNRFTLAFPGSIEPELAPAGDSVGWATNNSAGFATWGGYLADRTPIAQKVSISASSRIPVYIPAYRSATTYSNEFTHLSLALKTEYLGSLMGWVTISNASNPLGGTLTWTKKATGSMNRCSALVTNYYPDGFVMENSLISSMYEFIGVGAWPLATEAGMVTMQDGNLIDPLGNSFTISNTTVTKVIFDAPNSIKQILTFSPNGRFNSVFLNPDTGLRSVIYGVALQEQNIGRGSFLGTSQSGSFLLE